MTSDAADLKTGKESLERGERAVFCIEKHPDDTLSRVAMNP